MKVLLISVGAHFGGIEKLELEYSKRISYDNIQFDILALNDKTFKDRNIEELDNINIYDLGMNSFTRKNQRIYDYRLYKFLKKHKYDVIHINSDVFYYSFRVIIIAKLCGIKKVIMHSHGNTNTNILKKIFRFIMNPIYRSFVNKFLVCSEDAKKPLLNKGFINKNKTNKKVVILNNGIEVEKYKFDKKIRDKYRKELDINDKIVYGYISRLSKEKNHKYLIDLFNEIQKKQDNAVLVLAGEGPLENKIKEYVKELSIENKVIFLGFRNDVNKILNAMDCFIFPSMHEGLGIVAIEAQTNGLKVYCSNSIPIEAKISERLKYFDLSESKEKIAEIICKEKYDINDRKEAFKDTIKCGYDINDVCEKLKGIYEEV